MTKVSVIEDLALYGPTASRTTPPSGDEARRYCRRLTQTHYENFTVAGLLLPRPLRQHFQNIYAYCRTADDLADEAGSPQASLELLDWWSGELEKCYQGEANHPVFVALGETIRQFEIPQEPFHDLLAAFRQDQQVTRYETLDQLLDYCRYSANPVGRLVLHLGGCHRDACLDLSDSICTGLQLANFWQDVARDREIGRIYLPQEDCRKQGYDESMFADGRFNDEFRSLLAHHVADAESRLRVGLPLVDLVPGWLGRNVWLFAHGGLAILDAIRRQDYDVWSARPVVSKRAKIGLLWRCWWGHRRGRLSGGSA